MSKLKAQKMPSGNFRVQIMVDSRKYSITRPTAEEALAEAYRVKAGGSPEERSRRTLSSAIEYYITNREKLLSPSTIRGYRTIQRTRFQSLMSKPVSMINERQLQAAINTELRTASPKTVKNAAGLILSVIAEETG